MDDRTKFFLYLAGVPLLGVFAHWLAWRLRLPSILVLLVFGITLGRFIDPDASLAELTGGDRSVAPTLLFPLVSLSVAVILFAGGLSLRLVELREAGRAVLRLCTVGALVTWLLTWAATQMVLGFDPRIAALFGAIMVVTGPTVVIPLLRHIQPQRRVAATLKWEGIVIDPIGAVLAVLVFQEIAAYGADAPGGMVLAALVKTVVIGFALGLGGGAALARLVGRYLIPDHLQGAVFLTAAMGLFAMSNLLQAESGLVTVTVLGIYLANQRHASMRHVIEFKEHLVVLLIACLFIVLGSRLEPSDLTSFGWRGVLFLALMILVIRPASVFAALWGTELNWRERVFVASVAPRGIVAAAVTSVFSLEVAHLAAAQAASPEFNVLGEEARRLVPLAFLVIVGAVAIYGLAAGPLARRLGLAVARPQGLLLVGGRKWVRDMAAALHKEGVSVLLVDTNYRNVTEARLQGLPAHCTSILSEYVQDELDLSGVGRMLALTANDEVNSLACMECAHLFGRANVFQLPPVKTSENSRRESLGEHLRGRILFAPDAYHEVLVRRFSAGQQVKRTKITKEFTFDKFRERYGEAALVMFLRTEQGEVRVAATDKPLKPEPGDIIFALVKAVEETK